MIRPPCPECSTATELIDVEGGDVFRCPACERRTYGTGDVDDDQGLPPYSETDEAGGIVLFPGTGQVDIEATAEYASQEGPDDLDDEEPDGSSRAGRGRAQASGA